MKNATSSVLFLVLVPVLVVAGLAAARPVAAPQDADGLEFPKPSPAALMRSDFGLTTVEVAYSRPSMRGREIFGGLVPYGEVWRTGANEATRITFSTDVTFGGEPVPAGTYALFTIPAEGEWTAILNSVTGQWGAYAYDPQNDVVRVKAKASKLAEPVESFTIGLADLRDTSATLTLDWADTRVRVELGNDLVASLVPRIEAVMVSDAAEKPYFQAAMFYYQHDLDMAKAVDWMDAALLQQPDAVWMVYRKAKIQAKAGDTAGALATAQRALELAKKAGGSLGAEYAHLSETLLAELQG